jgi:hypothetical protein
MIENLENHKEHILELEGTYAELCENLSRLDLEIGEDEQEEVGLALEIQIL